MKSGGQETGKQIPEGQGVVNLTGTCGNHREGTLLGCEMKRKEPSVSGDE